MRSLLSTSIVALLILGVTLPAEAALRRPKHYQLDGYTFDKYVRDFGKKYSTPEETLLRRNQFEKTLKDVRAHNADKSQSWKAGVNPLSDRFPEELKRMNGGQSGNLPPAYKAELNSQPHVTAHVNTGAPLPESVDYRYRAPSVLTGIKSQGNCGSCWAHAATENIETYAAIATGEQWVLSQQEVTACAPNPDDCGGNGGCGGSIAELAYDYVKEHGITQEWNYPYTAGPGTTGKCLNQSYVSDVYLNGYTKVTTNSQEDVMDVLAHFGTLAINVDASKWTNYESGIFTGCGDYKNNQTITIDHVVQLVGYGKDVSAGMDYWVIRNSWSPAWGEKGFIRLYKNDTPYCGNNEPAQDGTACKGQPSVQYTCGECGILFDTSYPSIKLSN